MQRSTIGIVALCLLVSAASAETIQGIDGFEFVTIGAPGNAPDAIGSPNPCGAVDHVYRIGVYEITNAQWDQYAALTGAEDDSYYDDPQQPVNRVSWLEAIEFCNYLTTGDRHAGVYQFDGNGAFTGAIDQGLRQSTTQPAYFLPTEDEWYKAAYYELSRDLYWDYANGSNTKPTANLHTAYGEDTPPLEPWNVGSGAAEQNGTFDMMGNVWEMLETTKHRENVSLIPPEYWNTLNRLERGGDYDSPHTGYSELSRHDVDNDGISPTNESPSRGFRIASNNIPEPSTLALLGLLAAGWPGRRRG
jgi:sulfatase modifying factor 1